MKDRVTIFMEGLVTSAIVLVLVQTLLEDIMVLSGASWSVRQIFIFTGFAFDLFFTIEFLIRSWDALYSRQFDSYFLFQNGWIDFIASVPLLIFISAPELISYHNGTAISGAGALIRMLKVVKAVRITRVLRLLRLLKLFQRIYFADSLMMQRHLIRIITTVAATLIFINMILGIMFTFVKISGVEKSWVASQNTSMEYLSAERLLNTGYGATEAWGRSHPMILLIKDKERTLYAPHDDGYINAYFGPGDYVVYNSGSYTVWFDVRPFAVSNARLNLTSFLTTLTVILLLMITYAPHFALTVSEPVNVMMRGLKEKNYNSEVKIPQAYSRDEVFRLAAHYNEEYLPMKERNDTGNLDISLEDISDLLKP